LRSAHASIAIAGQDIRPPLLLGPLDEGALPTVGRAEQAGRGGLNLACNLTGSAEVAWPILARLVAARARLHGRAQLEAIEEVGGRQ
jgi:hypothetical protein